MNNRVICIFAFVIFVSSGLADCKENMRHGLFVKVSQAPEVFSSRKEVSDLIGFAVKAKIEILFVQIYYANRAWFPSQTADMSPYQKVLENVGEDPFQFLIARAHANGIKVHAWVNMLSLGNNSDAVFIKKYGAQILTSNTKKKRVIKDYLIDDQYFLEPGDERVREDLVSIVKEIVTAYPKLDGIQFDYIRYPDKEPYYGYTKKNMERFQRSAGVKNINEETPGWKDWKRAQVTELLELLVKSARDINPDIQVSATGCMPYARAYYEAFQDWPLWLKSGIVDFVTVMNYTPHTDEFERWADAIKDKVPDFSKVNIGIGVYKMSGSPKIFEQEYRFCEKSGCGACVLFDYEWMAKNPEFVSIMTGNRG